MKRMYERILVVLFLFTIVLGSAWALPNHTNQFYVNDFANVLNDDTKDYIFSNSRILDEKTSAQIVVATVDSLEGKSLEEYSISLARDWEVGRKDKNNGLLILLAPNERQIRIEVGRGLEGAINDGKAGRLTDKYAIPNFKNNDWDKGIKDLYMSLLSEVYKEYGMEVPEDIPNEIVNYNDGNDVGDLVIGIIVIVGLIILYLVYRKNGGNNNGSNDNGSMGPPFVGYYGGDSTFSSSGGSSFSGGGGSFGGGGASRGF